MEFKYVYMLVNNIGEMGVEFDNIEVDGNEVTIDGADYVVLDQEEINERMVNHVQETAAYFTKSFLSDVTELPIEVFEGLNDEAHDAVIALIAGTCGMDTFIDECLDADGAGHFLSPYDGNEIELIDGLSAFRVG